VGLSIKNVNLAVLVPNFNIEKVLVAPLDWGLGHATRCIPIINALLHNGYEVLVATSGKQLSLLQQEFPQLQFLKLKGYNISYAKKKWLLPFKITVQVPKILSSIKNEHHWLDKAIDEHKIDLVISDNRFGLHSKKVPCVFVTHQLTIKASIGWLEKMMQRMNYSYINKFNACWVPDLEGDKNVAGILSHPQNLPAVPAKYLGLLSRFEKKLLVEKRYDLCILLSGPEPQRTLLEEAILKGISSIKGTVLLVRGRPNSNESLSVPNHVQVKNHLVGSELEQAILQSELIISRSGYTTVMELLSLQKKSILIPTPGQTEQEYLGKRLMEQGWCFSINQDEFDLIKAIDSAKQFNYSFPSFENSSLQTLIPQLVESLQH
jgi:UDP:flavonoid glycosyltransferase YjiC (YdhE family)